MEPFIRNDQYQFIKQEAKRLANAHHTINDASVLEAMRSLAVQKVLKRFSTISEDQEEMLMQIVSIKDKDRAELFWLKLKPYVIPFPEITEQSLQKVFPKVKKLKAPILNRVDLRETSYMRWYDPSSNKTYMITRKNGKMMGVRGTMQSEGIKNVCTICNGHEDVALFMSESKKPQPAHL